jgi:two-component system, sensor histidine kinase and response regulator
MKETNIIDRAALATLLAMVGGDEAFLSEMIDAYFADTPQLLSTMRLALAAGDAATLRRSAHALKSNSANFGAFELVALCRELEELSGTGALDGAGAALAQVEAEYARVAPALSAARPSGGAQ